MDKATYLLRRREQAGEARYRERCYVCRRPRSTCLCAELRPFDPGVELVILMHMKEARRQKTGTGRLAHLTLQGSRLFEGIDFSNRREVSRLAAEPGVWPAILYPGPTSLNLSRGELTAGVLAGRRPRIFVIDGTWACAPAVFERSRNLQALPRVSFDPPFLSGFEIKRQPMPEALSTIEAIYCLLGELDRLGLTRCGERREGLLHVFRSLVNLQLGYEARPGGSRHLGYKRRRERRRATAP